MNVKSLFMNETKQLALFSWSSAAATLWEVLPEKIGWLITIVSGVAYIWKTGIDIHNHYKNKQTP